MAEIETLFTRAKLADGSLNDIGVAGGRIAAIAPTGTLAGTAPQVDIAGALLVPAFVEGVATLPDEAGLLRLVERFGVRRTDPRFWQVSDAIHAAWRRQAPGEAAVLDYSRLDDL